MKRIEVSVGQPFGDWKALGPSYRDGALSHVPCVCVCGTRKNVALCNLRSGKSTGCGCRAGSKISAAKTTHGHADSAEHLAWMRMRQRCENPKNKSFKNYGGRGITVCDRWRNDFAAFFSDMGPRPSANHSVDRINNDGPYSPENCRWATKVEQIRNRRITVRAFHGGELKPLGEIADATGLTIPTLYKRLRNGRPLAP